MDHAHQLAHLAVMAAQLATVAKFNFPPDSKEYRLLNDAAEAFSAMDRIYYYFHNLFELTPKLRVYQDETAPPEEVAFWNAFLKGAEIEWNDLRMAITPAEAGSA